MEYPRKLRGRSVCDLLQAETREGARSWQARRESLCLHVAAVTWARGGNPEELRVFRRNDAARAVQGKTRHGTELKIIEIKVLMS